MRWVATNDRNMCSVEIFYFCSIAIFNSVMVETTILKLEIVTMDSTIIKASAYSTYDNDKRDYGIWY